MNDTSKDDKTQALELDPKIAEEIRKAVILELGNALRSAPTTASSELKGAKRGHAYLAERFDWQTLIYNLTAVGAILGYVYVFFDILYVYARTETESLEERVEILRADMRQGIQAVRNDFGAENNIDRAEIGTLRGEISSLSERTASLETLTSERLAATSKHRQ